MVRPLARESNTKSWAELKAPKSFGPATRTEARSTLTWAVAVLDLTDH
jgi:hypothetical protein